MKMKRATMIFSAVALTFAMAGPVLAQMPMRPAAANADTSYFDEHPDLAGKLQKDPTLVDNQAFLNSHPGLHEYLKANPSVKKDFKSHPYRFMHRAEAYNKHHN
jgi:hypothetical protein